MDTIDSVCETEQTTCKTSGITSAEAFMAPQLRYPVWQESYIAAMLEMNSAAQRAKIAAAQAAIQKRMVGSRAEPEERQAILDALNALKFMNR
jgi:hypothetical protein